MHTRKLEIEWQEFAKAIFTCVKPSTVQYQEMRKAFYAGAYTVLCGVEEIGEPQVSEEEGERWLRSAIDDCVKFKDDLVKDLSAKQ